MGNYVILDMTIQEYRMTLVAIYGPNEDNPVFLENIKRHILDLQNSSIIIAGDWNVVQDFQTDTINYKTNNNIKAQKKVSELKTELDMVDIWRIQNPDSRKFTWRGPRGKMSRLDYFLISSDFEPFITKSDIGISYRSDHSPVSLSFKFHNQTRGKGVWKFNNSLLYDKDYVKEIKNCINETVNQYSDTNSNDMNLTINPHLFWETLKCMIRGKTISYSSFIKRQNQKVEKELENELENLHILEGTNPNCKDIKDNIKDAEDKLKVYREKKINGIMARAKARWETEGEKCTNYFCNLEKRHYNEKIIPKLIVGDGQEINDQFLILNEQKVFYETLYTSSNPIYETEHENLGFFFNSDNPYINKLDQEKMVKSEGELQRSECLQALKNFKNGKSPGLDGFTVEFYKFFWNDLYEFIIQSFNYSLEVGSFSISQRQGMITCIPKEGKSKSLLKNWRPITLLNVDLKIASAALANRIKPFLDNIISETQQGFIKGRYIGECTRLIYDLIENAEEDEIQVYYYSLILKRHLIPLNGHLLRKLLNSLVLDQFFVSGFRHYIRTLKVVLLIMVTVQVSFRSSEGFDRGIRYHLIFLFCL